MAYKCKTPSAEEMLEAGVHFGHQVKRWNPKMKRYIYDTDNKSHVIDIYQTQELLEKACEKLYEVAKSGKQIILVGTKRQASDIIEKYAAESSTLYVSQRWLGGTFTNYASVQGKWKELQSLKSKRDNKELAHLTKKERLLIDRKIEKLELFVGGIQDMKRFPGAIVVVDVKREKTAVAEAHMLEVPVIAMVDTNSAPDLVDFVIPANDDAIKSIELIISTLSIAIQAGYKDYEPGKTDVPATTATSDTPAKDVKGESKNDSTKKEKTVEKKVVSKVEPKTKAKPKAEVKSKTEPKKEKKPAKKVAKPKKEAKADK